MQGRIHSIESFGTVDGPGVRLVVFMQGCPLRCLYCHNPDTWRIDGGTLMEPSEILELYERNADFYVGGGITVTGGEPLLQVEFLLELFTLAKRNHISTCIDTSGITFDPNDYHGTAQLNHLLQLTDLVMLDIKQIDPIKHQELTGITNASVLAFALYLEQKRIPMWVRHVVIPGYTDDDQYLYELGYFIGQFHYLKALDILPYHTMGTVKYEKLGIPYRLKDVPPMDKKIAVEKKKVILAGIRKRRLELSVTSKSSKKTSRKENSKS
jgi:pyruvate formate lyase activating enzyme